MISSAQSTEDFQLFLAQGREHSHAAEQSGAYRVWMGWVQSTFVLFVLEAGWVILSIASRDILVRSQASAVHARPVLVLTGHACTDRLADQDFRRVAGKPAV